MHYTTKALPVGIDAITEQHRKRKHSTPWEEEEGGESLLQLLESVKLRLFTHGVDVAHPSSPASTPFSSPASSPRSSPMSSRRVSVTEDASGFTTDLPFCFPPPPQGSTRKQILEAPPREQCELYSPFWESALAALQHSEQNTLSLLGGFLDKVEDLGREEDVQSFFTLPSFNCQAHANPLPKENQPHFVASASIQGDCELRFSEERFEIFDHADVEKVFGATVQYDEATREHIGVPRKRRRHYYPSELKGKQEAEVVVEEGIGFYKETASAGFVDEGSGKDVLYDEEVILQYFDVPEDELEDFILADW